jgi:hypothetical protein
MMLLADAAKRILAHGGSLRIPLKGYIAPTLEELAAFAASGKARLEIVVGDGLLLADAMERIAAIGKGYVLFDIYTDAKR